MSEINIAIQLNRFCKSGDLHGFRRKVRNFTPDERRRLAENLNAGDEVETAIRDARGYQTENTEKWNENTSAI